MVAVYEVLHPERVSPCGLWHCGSFLLCNATCAENIRLRFGDLCLRLKVKSADEFRVGIVAAYFNGQLFAGMVEEKSLQCRETSVLDKGGWEFKTGGMNWLRRGQGGVSSHTGKVEYAEYKLNTLTRLILRRLV